MTQKGKEENSSAARKERVLHTRIPAVLEKELKEMARSLRVPVSNVVRTILEDAVSAADRVGRVAEKELREAAERLTQERERLHEKARGSGEKVGAAIAEAAKPEAAKPEAAKPEAAKPEAAKPEAAKPEAEPEAEPEPDALEDVVGFQPLVLARGAECAGCGRDLAAGEDAFMAIRSGGVGGSPIIVGPECVPGRR